MEGMKFDQGKSASYLIAHDVVIHDEHTSWSPAFYMARLREWWNRASTLPALALVNEDFEGLVKVLEFGAKKYAARNWEAGIAYHRVFRAADKHYRNIGTLDAETSLPHLHHFLCCYMFLAAYTARGLHQFDDRPGVARLYTLQEVRALTRAAASGLVVKVGEEWIPDLAQLPVGGA